MKRLIIWISDPPKLKLLILLIFILLIIDFIIIKNASFGNGVDLEGQIRSPKDVENDAIRSITYGIPFLSVLLGSIISLFLPKQTSYKVKLLVSSLILILISYFAFLIIGIRNLILW